MGVEDLSLDDIIKERRASRKRQNNSEMYSDRLPRSHPTFPQRKRQVGSNFTAKKQQTQKGRNIVDARFLIGNRAKTQITDARQRITPKPVVDARQKLQAKHNLNRGSTRGSQTGKIPKVTFSNELADKNKSQVVFHVTQGSKAATNGNARRNFSNSGITINQRVGAGIKIAVKNDRAKLRSEMPPGAAVAKKTFERLKITTINKEAMRRKPPLPPQQESPPTSARPLRKRTMHDSDESFDDVPDYGKQRRQQRTEPMDIPETYERQHTKPQGLDLRPMISKQVEAKKSQIVVENDVLPGPSPIEGTKLQVFNLHPAVTEDDILELFSVLGAVRRARLVKPGEAEVVYIRHDNAMTAYKKYNNRDLDGQPMQIEVIASDVPKPTPKYSWMKEVKSSRKRTDTGEVTELHSGVLQQALFKGGSTGTSTRPVVFTVKI